ncbi:hypothetical protein AN191_17255 [Loktanella sp. 5RATIMAR09]|uniref:hypothetical protein n=1 Tax=Loktanella sp. 5RATIMAR09 TaxID=1225655 RepID=UPI0006EBB83A|nr:hypothetical protein [Loktanella sp. 5RATIMAR09]KQI70623.1 hypothetical protein AN191_17255 [Loktanella sp. 5RATIMAR09]
MTNSRRVAMLLFFSALVTPAQAMANCPSDRIDIPRNFGRDLSTSVIRQVFVGAVVAVGAASVLPIGAVGAVGIFTTIVLYGAVIPAMRRASDNAFNAFDNAFEI